jgi:hypothetical protein
MDNFTLEDIKNIPKTLNYYFDEVSLQPAIAGCGFVKSGDSLVMRIPAQLREQLFGVGNINDSLFEIKKMGKANAFVLSGEKDEFLVLRIKKGDRK